MKPLLTGAGALAAGTLLTGCSFTGINSVPLPLAEGSRSDALHVTVVLENAANLVPNSEVKYRDVTVGSVRKVVLDDDWHARLTIGIDPHAGVPNDVTARVAQKSLLGAEYLDLSNPQQTSPTRAAANGAATSASAPAALGTGDVIGLARTGRYPETEELLTAASMLFNGGGLPQLQIIETELNQALGGHAQEIRELVRNVNTFTATLNKQRDSILDTLAQLNRLSGTVNDHSAEVTRALNELPAGFKVLDQERAAIVEALESLARLHLTTSKVLAPSADRLARLLADIRPITRHLAEAGPELARLLENLTYPFPLQNTTRWAHGDMGNVDILLRLDVPEILKNFLGGTALDGALTSVVGGLPTGPAVDSSNPLLPSVKEPDAELPKFSAEGSGSGSSTAPGASTSSPPAGDSSSGLLGLLGGS